MKKIFFILFLLMLSTSLTAQNLLPTPQNALKKQTGTVTDIDGNVYNTIVIGDQEWMVENLKVTKYRNGDAIPSYTDNSEWINLTTGALSTYDNADSNVSVYGYLYNWYAADDSRGLAPEGWRIPSDEDWKELELYLGMDQVTANNEGYRGTDEGGKLKSTGTLEAETGLWISPNLGATNETGFGAIPSGYRNSSGDHRLGEIAAFWSMSVDENDYVWSRYLSYELSGIHRGTETKTGGGGLSIRCVRNVVTSVHDGDNKLVPSGYELSQNYPNPFNPETSIRFSIPKPGEVKLVVYNVLGERVKTLVSGNLAAGEFNIVWDGTNRAGEKVSSGFYLYRLQTDSIVLTKKMLLIK